jgi:hypothetical protein
VPKTLTTDRYLADRQRENATDSHGYEMVAHLCPLVTRLVSTGGKLFRLYLSVFLGQCLSAFGTEREAICFRV